LGPGSAFRLEAPCRARWTFSRKLWQAKLDLSFNIPLLPIWAMALRPGTAKLDAGSAEPFRQWVVSAARQPGAGGAWFGTRSLRSRRATAVVETRCTTTVSALRSRSGTSSSSGCFPPSRSATHGPRLVRQPQHHDAQQHAAVSPWIAGSLNIANSRYGCGATLEAIIHGRMRSDDRSPSNLLPATQQRGTTACIVLASAHSVTPCQSSGRPATGRRCGPALLRPGPAARRTVPTAPAMPDVPFSRGRPGARKRHASQITRQTNGQDRTGCRATTWWQRRRRESARSMRCRIASSTTTAGASATY